MAQPIERMITRSLSRKASQELDIDQERIGASTPFTPQERLNRLRNVSPVEPDLDQLSEYGVDETKGSFHSSDLEPEDRQPREEVRTAHIGFASQGPSMAPQNPMEGLEEPFLQTPLKQNRSWPDWREPPESPLKLARTKTSARKNNEAEEIKATLQEERKLKVE